MSLEEEAEKRRKRLRMMRQEAQEHIQEEEGKKEVALKFRNYLPHDKGLAFESVKAAPVPDATPHVKDIKESVSKLRELTGVKEAKAPAGFVRDPDQEGVAQEPSFPDAETPLADLAPKKANWDLKRDVEPRLAKLKKRTDRAILELLREKVAREQGGEGGEGDVVAVVHAQEQAAGDSDSE